MRRLACAAPLLLALAACAHEREALRLEVTPGIVEVVPGASRELGATLVNRSAQKVRLEQDSGVRFIFLCSRAEDPPGQVGRGTSSAMGGIVFGGVEDVPRDPHDPEFCRAFPPDAYVLAPGERRPLTTTIEVPEECVAGPARLEVYFEGTDDLRHCPGYWRGRTPTIVAPARVRATASPSTASPARTGGSSP
jgi:hypothetical protein